MNSFCFGPGMSLFCLYFWKTVLPVGFLVDTYSPQHVAYAARCLLALFAVSGEKSAGSSPQGRR